MSDTSSMSFTAHMTDVVGRLHRRLVGKGPGHIKIDVAGPVVIIRSTGYLTPLERTLACEAQGRQVALQARDIALKAARDMVARAFREHLGVELLSMMADADLERDTQWIVIVLDTEATRLRANDEGWERVKEAVS